MRVGTTFIATAAGLAFLTGCADPYATGPTTTTNTVVRDSAGNPIASGSVTRDANGNIISSTQPGTYESAPVAPYPRPYRSY